MAGDVVVGIGLLDFLSSSSISGTNLLTIAAGATVRFDHSSTFPGSMTVDGTFTLTSPSAIYTISGVLTLNASGTVENAGTIRAGTFINNGGTIIPPNNPPVKIGPALRISNIQLGSGSASSSPGLQKELSSPTVILSCRGQAGQGFEVQGSTDLVHWSNEAVAITETAPGTYQVRISVAPNSVRFFRLQASGSTR